MYIQRSPHQIIITAVACSLHSSVSGNINCKEGCARNRDEVVIVPADVGRVRIFINICCEFTSQQFRNISYKAHCTFTLVSRTN
jgi:hypothetical protein